MPPGSPSRSSCDLKTFADYIRQIAPATVEVKVTAMHGGQGYVCPISLPAYQAAEKDSK